MPAVGSSRHSTRAPDAMRHASSTTRRVPVDSSLMKRSTNAPSPRNAMTSSGFGSRAMRCQGRTPGTARPTVSRTVRSWNSSAPWNDRPRPRRARRAGEKRCTSWPRISTAPRLRHESADRVHQRRLARAVRADEPDDLARRNVQVDVDRRRRRGPNETLSARPGSPRRAGAGISRRGDARRARAAAAARPARSRASGMRRARNANAASRTL